MRKEVNINKQRRAGGERGGHELAQEADMSTRGTAIETDEKIAIAREAQKMCGKYKEGRYNDIEKKKTKITR